MDIISLIGIIVAIALIYFVIRYIVSPIIKAIVSIIIFLILIYLSQRFFGFDLNHILAPFGISLDMDSLKENFDWVLKPINYFADQIKNFWNYIWKNVPK